MKRALKIAGLTLVVLLVIVAASLVWLGGTESGSRWALARVQGLMDGITIGGVRGRLADSLLLTDVHVTMEGLELEVARLWLEWSPGALLQGRLRVAELGAEGVVYRMLPAPEPAAEEPFSLPERIELPLAVTLGRLRIADVTVYTGPDAEPVQVDQVLLTEASYMDARLEVPRLELASPLVNADGRLAVTAAGDYPLEAAVDWHLELSGYAPVDGTTRLDGSLASLQLDQRLAPPYRTRVEATATALFDPSRTPTLAASVAVNDLRLSAVQADLPEATVSLDLQARGPLDALEVSARASGSDAEQRRFVANLQAAVTPDALAVRRLEVRQPGREGRLTGEGRIALAGNLAADLDVEWHALRWPLTGEPTVTSPRGTLKVSGPLDDYRFRLATRLEPADAPPLELTLDGTGDRGAASLTLEAQAGAGSVQGQVQATWDPVVEAQATLQARDLDPSVLLADWPGAVDLNLEAAGRTEGERLQVSVSRFRADGQLRGQALSAAATGTLVQQGEELRVDVPELTASLGDSRLTLQGRVAEQADLRWQLESPDLSALLPEAEGRIAGSGSITGTMPRVKVAAQLEGEALAYGDYRLERLDLQADVDLSGGTRSSLHLAARGGTAGETVMQSFTVDGSGTPAEHQLDLALDADAGRARLALQGAMEQPWSDSPAWHFTLARGELGYGGLPPWRLAGAATGTVAPPTLTVQSHCWAADEARVCLEGRRDAETTSARLALTNLGFAYFAPLLPEDLTLTGTLDGSADLTMPGNGPMVAHAELRSSAGELTLPAAEPDVAAAVIGLGPSRVRVDIDASRAQGEAELAFEHGSMSITASTAAAIAGDGSGVTGPVTDQPLSGRIRLEVPDLAFVSKIIPTVQDMAGALNGDVTIAGTLADPAFTGAVELTGGTVTVPEAGITVEALSASVRGLGREGLALSASATSGDGSIELDGRMSLPGEVPTARLTLIGAEFEALNNEMGRVVVSPDLVMDAGAERITVTGTVFVPEANLTPGAQPPSAIAVSEDQVLVSPEAAPAAGEGRALYAEIRLILGEEVHFEGFGLTADFEGEVLIHQEPETPTTATGEIAIVDGEYRAYGQGLVIDEGRIYFAGGPVTQPALDIRAVRRPAEDILVGAQVGGTLESPTFELFSEPAMTQQEQLSWLILGRSLQDSPDGQGDALSRAALAMGLRGGEFLAKNIGDLVGVDEIGIETGSGEAGAPSDPSQAALVVGEYLSPKLYVSYGFGLFNPMSVLKMQYEISSHWQLVTQSSGEATGADVLYTVEVGGN